MRSSPFASVAQGFSPANAIAGLKACATAVVLVLAAVPAAAHELGKTQAIASSRDGAYEI